MVKIQQSQVPQLSQQLVEMLDRVGQVVQAAVVVPVVPVDQEQMDSKVVVVRVECVSQLDMEVHQVEQHLAAPLRDRQFILAAAAAADLEHKQITVERAS
jgi:hypothetical protein